MLDRRLVVWLIAFKGMSGSGKSTVARALSQQLGWALIDKDDIKDILDQQTPDAGRLAYDVMFNVARRQLLQGLSAICDSPLTFRSLYDQARQLAAHTGATLAVVECYCGDETAWRQRINARKALALPAHHQTDWAAFQVYRAQVEGQMQYPIADPRLLIDTTQPLSYVITEVLSWLAQHGRLNTRVE